MHYPGSSERLSSLLVLTYLQLLSKSYLTLEYPKLQFRRFSGCRIMRLRLIKSRLAPPVVFLGAITIPLIRLVVGCFTRPLDVGIVHQKLWNCFVGWEGVVIVSVLAAICLYEGWSALKEAWARMTVLEVWIFFITMAIADIWIGRELFETSGFYHSMFRWSLHNYLEVVGGNMFRSFVPTAFVLFLLRPWRIVPKVGLWRTVSLGTAVLLLNYMFTFLAYAGSLMYEVE